MKKSLRTIIILVVVVGLGLVGLTTYLGRESSAEIARKRALLAEQAQQARAQQLSMERSAREAELERRRQLNEVKVVMRSKVSLHPGEIIKKGDYEWVRARLAQLPRGVLSQDMVKQLPFPIDNMIAKSNINKAQLITLEMVEGAPASTVFLRKLKPGMAIYAVPVNLRRGTGSLIREGSRVNVLYEYQGQLATILNNVRVVGTRQLGQASGYGDVFLEVTPQMAQMLRASESQEGKIQLLPKSFRPEQPPLKTQLISAPNDLVNKYFINSKAKREDGEVHYIKAIKGDKIFFYRVQNNNISTEQHKGGVVPTPELKPSAEVGEQQPGPKAALPKNVVPGSNKSGAQAPSNSKKQLSQQQRHTKQVQ